MIRNPFLKTEGIHNFRDYGGYGVSGGGKVKKGLLFRSGQHVEASEEDLKQLDKLAIQTVIDLRGESERMRYPCRRIGGFAAEVVAYDGETSNAPPHEAAAEAGMTPERAFERMIAVYTRMPVNPAMTAMFGRYLRALADREGSSLVHCFAGKDRTGIAVMLLQHALGVHHDDIVTEFLLTNEAPNREILHRQSVPRMEAIYGPLDPEAVHNLLGVRAEYIETFLAEVERVHGSLDAYLENVLDVDEALRTRLRERLVT